MSGYNNPVLVGADPFVILHDGVYYHYATDAPDGYYVYSSSDLKEWKKLGYGLKKGDVKGEKWFWAPEILEADGRFYMAYTSDEHLGIAVSDSPAGPFAQKEKRFLSERCAIDGDFLVDDDGAVYLYYVRFQGGNVIYGTRLAGSTAELAEKVDSLSIDDETKLLEVEEKYPWETIQGRVAEGPFVLKHGGKYYLTYSANDYKSRDYAIGYAVSDSPLGPFVKYEGNPILRRSDRLVGVGHHSFTSSKDGKRLICVYHCHNSLEKIHPRLTCFDDAFFDESGVLHIEGPSVPEHGVK